MYDVIILLKLTITGLGECKSWTVDSELDCGLDSGLEFRCSLPLSYFSVGLL